MKVFIVHGLKRSGNHAIINWILEQTDMNFFNNIIPISPILKGQEIIPNTIDFIEWINNPKNMRFLEKKTNNDDCIISIEDHSVNIKPFIFNHKINVKHLLILRDPINLFSSRIRKAFFINNPAYPWVNNENMQRAINLWIEHANEFFNITHNIINKLCISFNEWYSDLEYRKDLSNQLGIHFSDKGYKTISLIGGGSSFDNTKYLNTDETYNLLNRNTLLNNYEKCLLDEVITDIKLKDIYGVIDKFTMNCK
ncbi:MAG TPA: hypothetical protein PLK12_02115 [Prolixibacteraceae bacterium]|nr:hypothetical protein [Prolixibacteraceae bacterium]